MTIDDAIYIVKKAIRDNCVMSLIDNQIVCMDCDNIDHAAEEAADTIYNMEMAVKLDEYKIGKQAAEDLVEKLKSHISRIVRIDEECDTFDVINRFLKELQGMTINGVKIKKYKARVKDRNAFTTSPEPVSTDGYKIVEGYVSIQSIILNDNEPNKPQFVPVFVAEEIDFGRMSYSGMGQSVFKPAIYGENEFILIGEADKA